MTTVIKAFPGNGLIPAAVLVQVNPDLLDLLALFPLDSLGLPVQPLLPTIGRDQPESLLGFAGNLELLTTDAGNTADLELVLATRGNIVWHLPLMRTVVRGALGNGLTVLARPVNINPDLILGTGFGTCPANSMHLALDYLTAGRLDRPLFRAFFLDVFDFDRNGITESIDTAFPR